MLIRKAVMGLFWWHFSFFLEGIRVDRSLLLESKKQLVPTALKETQFLVALVSLAILAERNMKVYKVLKLSNLNAKF